MPQTTYTYALAAFTTSGGLVNNTTLRSEIAASAIVETCDWINTDPTNCDIVFANTLTAGDVLILDALVAVHPAYFPADDVVVGFNEFLLEYDPPSPGTDYSYITTSGYVTQEKWLRADTSNLKTIDYTYASGLVATEVRKVFGLDGVLIVAQKTGVYTWTGSQVSIAWTRDV